MKIIYNKIIPFKGFSAINLFGVVFARKECGTLHWQTMNHELIHTAQMKELFYIFFYLFYALEWLVKLCFYGNKAYYHISFEKEAYAHQNDSGYLTGRKKYAFLKYLKI
jgi:hypothetical protein